MWLNKFILDKKRLRVNSQRYRYKHLLSPHGKKVFQVIGNDKSPCPYKV